MVVPTSKLGGAKTLAAAVACGLWSQKAGGTFYEGKGWGDGFIFFRGGILSFCCSAKLFAVYDAVL